MQVRRTSYRCKRIIVYTMIITMIFTMHMPYAFALGEPWEGTAKGDVFMQDTVTKRADQVYEHEVITNNEN